MNPAPQTPNPMPPAPPGGGISLDDILFTLFRHKWLILGFFCLGLAGALGVRMLRPPSWYSRAKLLIPYIVEGTPGPGAEDKVIRMADNGGTLNNEIEILYSHDVVSNAAFAIGPDKFVTKDGGPVDQETATKIISGGLEVEQPRNTSILMVFFKNRDPGLVQPVLKAVLDNYMLGHVKSHIRADLGWSRQRSEELKKSLRENEERQKTLKTENHVLILDDTKHSFHAQLDKVRNDLYEAERDLAGRRAVLGDAALPGSASNGSAKSKVQPEIIEQYATLLNDLAELKRKDRDCASQGLLPAHPMRLPIQGQIEKLEKQKKDMLSKYSALTQFNVSSGATNSSGTGLAADLAEIKRLSGNVEYLRMEFTNVQQKVVSLLDLEAQLHDLERQHSNDETNYNFIARNIELEQSNEMMGSGKLMNITTFEHPTPPVRDSKKLKKQLLGVFGACIACGLGLAFLIDFVLDRSVKRRADIERALQVPVLQSIPDTVRPTALAWPLSELIPKRKPKAAHQPINGNGDSNGALALWNPVHHLHSHAEGLRERIMTYFEVRNMNLKKPKLVGLTSCNVGSGVTTLATGLAAALSKTGNGNVLLVDMNGEHGSTHSFHHGQPGDGMSDEHDFSFPGNEQDLPGAVENYGMLHIGPLAEFQPHRLSQLLPKLKASDYDYIVFDMPPVSQTSSSPRMSGYMDIVLLVLEAEKTAQQTAVRANALMKESRANVAAVLNKCRQYVPAGLGNEF